MNRYRIAFYLLVATLAIFIIRVAYIYAPDFLRSNFLLALTTFFVGGFAIYLYKRQKYDYKKDSANIILMEIRNAEKIIDSIKEGQPIDSNVVLLPTNSWVKNGYIFINDLDGDQLTLINKFYNQCTLIDKALSQLSLSVQLEQKSNHIHKNLVELASEITRSYTIPLDDVTSDTVKKIFLIRKQNFLNIIEKDGYAFFPAGPRNEIQNALNRIEKVTTSMAGDKLKKIANLTQ